MQMPSGGVGADRLGSRERRIESLDPEPFAKLAYPNGGPCLAIDGFAPHSVQGHRQLTVRQLAAERSDRRRGARVSIGRVTSGPHARGVHIDVAGATTPDTGTLPDALT